MKARQGKQAANVVSQISARRHTGSSGSPVWIGIAVNTQSSSYRGSIDLEERSICVHV